MSTVPRTAASSSSSDAPEPDLLDVDGIPGIAYVGQLIEIEIEAENDRNVGLDGSSITVSIDHSKGADEVVVDADEPRWSDDFYFYEPDEGEVWHEGKDRFIENKEWFIEATDDEWRKREEHTLSFKIIPQRTGILYIRVRTTMSYETPDGLKWENDHSVSSGRSGVDQQGWDVEEYRIEVVEAEPNLRGKKFTAGQTQIAGEHVTVDFSIENIGMVDAGSFDVSFYLSRDDDISISDHLLETISFSDLDADDDTGTQDINLLLPNSHHEIYDGRDTYYLGMIIDVNDDVDESDETDNSSYHKRDDYDDVVILGDEETGNVQLELYRITDASYSAGKNTSNPGDSLSQFYPGQTVRITLKANNLGTMVPAEAVLEIRDPADNHVYDSYELGQDNFTHTPLITGETAYYSFDWIVPDSAIAGYYDIIASIRNHDEWETVLDTTAPDRADTDFDNARLENRFRVLAAPNLRGKTLVTDDMLIAGQEFEVNYAVENTGNDDAENFLVTFYLSSNDYISENDYKLGQTRINGLNAGQHTDLRTGVFRLPDSHDDIWDAGSSYYIGMIVDSSKRIDESEEGDNRNLGTNDDMHEVDVEGDLQTGNVELSLHRITDASYGDGKNTSNPGQSLTQFFPGQKVRVTLKAHNLGATFPAVAILEIRDPYDVHKYDSDRDDQNNDAHSPLSYGETAYYSFEWEIPLDANLGEYDLIFSLRNSIDWWTTSDTSAPGRADSDYDRARLENQFEVVVAPSESDVNITVRYDDGQLISGDELNALIIWQDNYQNLFEYKGQHIIDPTSGSFTFEQLPDGHTYYIQAYVNDMLVGTQVISDLQSDASRTITAPKQAEVQASVYYADGLKPLSGAVVQLFNHEGYVWREGLVEYDGTTRWGASDIAYVMPNDPSQSEYWFVKVIYQDQIVYESISIDLNEGVRNICSITTKQQRLLTGEMLYEYLAKAVVYASGPNGDSGPSWHDYNMGNEAQQAQLSWNPLYATGYVVDEVLSNITGFFALGLVSEIDPTDAILVFRGTEGFFNADFISDLMPSSIGLNQFVSIWNDDNGFESITDWLDKQIYYDRKVSLLGHSLGGALAQYTAVMSTYSGYEIKDVATFNSPGITRVIADLFEPDNVTGSVSHYITSGDIVSMAGQAFIDGSYYLYNFYTPSITVSVQSVITSVPVTSAKRWEQDKHLLPVFVPSINQESDLPRIKPDDVSLVYFGNSEELSSSFYSYLDSDQYYNSGYWPVVVMMPNLAYRWTTETMRSLGFNLLLDAAELIYDGYTDVVEAEPELITAVNDTRTINEDVSIVIDVLSNDDSFMYSPTLLSYDQPGHGTLSRRFGMLEYTPDPDWYGTDLFAYTITDMYGNIDSAVVKVVVQSQNDAPQAAPNLVSTDYQTAIDIDVLSNDFDVDGDTLAVSDLLSATSKLGVALAINPDNSVHYDPSGLFGTLEPGQRVRDEFRYQITDDGGKRDSHIVFVDVIRPLTSEGQNFVAQGAQNNFITTVSRAPRMLANTSGVAIEPFVSTSSRVEQAAIAWLGQQARMSIVSQSGLSQSVQQPWLSGLLGDNEKGSFRWSLKEQGVEENA